jgi:hypothetical protein
MENDKLRTKKLITLLQGVNVLRTLSSLSLTIKQNEPEYLSLASLSNLKGDPHG